MDNVQVEARKAFENLPWPHESWESWRRTPIDKFRLKERFQQFSDPSGNKEGLVKPTSIVGGGDAREGWALEVQHTPHSWVYYGSKETQQIELYDWYSEFPKEAASVIQKRIQNLSDRMQAWNLAYPTVGLILRIPPRVRLSAPILIRMEEEGVLSLPHLLVLLERDSEAQIVVRFDARKTQGIFLNGGITYKGEENAHGTLVVDRVLPPSEGSFFLSFEGFLQRDATLHSTEVHVGGPISKSTWKVELEGKGAKAELKGAYMASPGNHIEMDLTQSHRSGNTQSNSLYKGVVASGGKSVFQGLIVVSEGASRTDAYLANRNLLLGSGARADSIPRLHIGNDDVRCTHGSTTGKLNETQLFYLRSRGIPAKEARRILIEGFFEEVISSIPSIYRENVLNHMAETLQYM